MAEETAQPLGAAEAPGAPPPASKHRLGARLREERRWAALFLAPDMFGVLAFTAFPVIAAVVLSFLIGLRKP